MKPAQSPALARNYSSQQNDIELMVNVVCISCSLMTTKNRARLEVQVAIMLQT